MAFPRSQWAEIDAFLSRQSLTLQSTYHDVYNVHGGRISLSWPGYGGHIEIAYEGGTYLVRLPHDLVRAGLVPFMQSVFEDTGTPCLLTPTRDPNAIVRLLSEVLAPVLAHQDPRMSSKRRGDDDDDFVPQRRTGALFRLPLPFGGACRR